MALVGGLSVLEAVLYPAAILLWAYVVYMILDLSDTLWGTKYTAALPQFVGADTLILVIVVLQPVVLIVGSTVGVEATYSYALTALQILAGILFARGMNEVYQIEWVTAGFDALEVNGDG